MNLTCLVHVPRVFASMGTIKRGILKRDYIAQKYNEFYFFFFCGDAKGQRKKEENQRRKENRTNSLRKWHLNRDVVE